MELMLFDVLFNGCVVVGTGVGAACPPCWTVEGGVILNPADSKALKQFFSFKLGLLQFAFCISE